MNRSRTACTGLLLLVTVIVAAADLRIETAFTRYYTDEGILPIADYFRDAVPGQSFRTVVSSDPEKPAGQYFIMRLKGGTGKGTIARARMTLYATDSKEPREEEWDLEGIDPRKWLYLGITGTDWPGEAVQPLAWRIRLLDTTGGILAEWKSFLWEQP
ncbi:MAG: hypothetical protein R6V45_02130 [Oceanipulchritudo sp.]